MVLVVKIPPTNAGDTGLIPGPARFQLSPCVTTAEPQVPQLLKPAHPRTCVLQQEKPPQRKAQAPELESSLHAPQLEKAHVQQQRPSAVKNL